LGWRWWYGVFGIVSAVIFVLSFLFVLESRYDRPTDAFEGAVHIHRAGQDDGILRVTTQHGVELDHEKYLPRSFKHNLKIFHGSADWKAAGVCLYQAFQCLFFPNILWIVLMNSAVLGIYVVMITSFGSILLAPPYNFAFTSLGFVQGGQIVVSLIMVPLFGYGGDWLTKVLARRRNGMSEPESRLIPMLIPTIVVIVSCVVYGKAGSDPNNWSPWAVIVTFNAEFFGFITVVLLGYTYSLDAYPERAAPILVLICAVRGFISFGISFGITKFIKVQGYDGSFNICAIVMGVISAFGFLVYIFGKKIRSATTKYAVDGKSAESE
jgi:Major Facilitator Superfamily